MSILSERLAEARKASGFSQKGLAEMLGISAQRMNYYESGRSEPDTGMLRKMAEALGVTVNYLLDSEPVREDMNLTPDEIRLLKAYRKASERDKGMVRYVLEPYMDVEVEKRGIS